MPQSLANVLIHIAFSTKNRKPLLANPEFQAKTHAYIAGVTKTLDCPAVRIGGVADHVHLLVSLARTITIADFVKEAKRASTNWIQGQGLPTFHWQTGYAAFSIDRSRVQEVVAYIERQAEHHQLIGFQNQFRRLLRENNMAFDERYIWD